VSLAVTVAATLRALGSGGLRGLRVAIASVLLAAAASACSSTSPCTHAPVSSSPVEGVVVAVDASGLANVHGFTLRQSDGSTVAFTLGALDNAAVFAPGHLESHQATSIPIRVYFRVVGGSLVVYHLDDATIAPIGTSAPVTFSCP
jgi:hypothetical protein